MPMWVDRKEVRFRVNQSGDRINQWAGRYLVIDGLTPNDIITIEFHLVKTTEQHTEPSYDITYTCEFKGNTLIDISPRTDRPARIIDSSDDGSLFEVRTGYPIYLRDFYKKDLAPVKTVERFVAQRII